MKFRKLFLALILSACAQNAGSDVVNVPNSPQVSAAPLAASAVKGESFSKWLSGFKQKARNAGISEQTIKSALSDITENKRVISLDGKQPEHKITKEEYLAKVINDYRVQKGRKLLVENKALLEEISKKSGVEPQFIVALWGLETGYGENTGGFNVVESLATLAYEGRRREFFESELLAALVIIEQGHITATDMTGSWAGAMGQCQFMPTSFLAYAVDYNNDAKVDIWGTKADVFASIANYLNTVGWGKDKLTKEKALMHWNKSSYFVASVFKLAEEIE